jgi:hypothetical protein
MTNPFPRVITCGDALSLLSVNTLPPLSHHQLVDDHLLRCEHQPSVDTLPQLSHNQLVGNDRLLRCKYQPNVDMCPIDNPKNVDVSKGYSSHVLDNVLCMSSSLFKVMPPYSILIYNLRCSVPDIWLAPCKGTREKMSRIDSC